MRPILLLGAGRMGGALIEGWGRAGAFAASDIMVRDPQPGAFPAGVRVNPVDEELAAAQTVVLAVKPQIWREASAAIVEYLALDAVVVSIAAGVRADDIAEVYGGRRVARVMPTTAVAIGQGTASVFASDAEARSRVHALFESVATVVDLSDEELMHAATAVSGSAPAYLYAFVEALEAAGVEAGLEPAAASGLARSTIAGAAALMAQSGAEPAELRKQVTSPGGTTQAALEVLMAELPELMSRAVAAAAKRSRELGS
ncbi:MAG: pyrroline-5-carboxylate reductase [Parcubacteria group bacterium]